MSKVSLRSYEIAELKRDLTEIVKRARRILRALEKVTPGKYKLVRIETGAEVKEHTTLTNSNGIPVLIIAINPPSRDEPSGRILANRRGTGRMNDSYYYLSHSLGCKFVEQTES